VKELKGIEYLAEFVADEDSWNPVKELKESPISYRYCTYVVGWNPVKELKDGKKVSGVWTFAFVESGEGAESQLTAML